MLSDLTLRPAEDVVEYYLFPKRSAYPSLDSIRVLKNEIDTYSKEFLGDYIWQNDPFSISLHQGYSKPMKYTGSNNSHLLLYGITRFGDNMEDEAVITYLLFEISKRWPDIFIRVTDSDGQYLLIEAANFLPKWIKPELMDYRVWIVGGKIHILSLSIFMDDDPKESIKTALKVLEDDKTSYIAHPDIQLAIQKPIKNIPKALKESVHWQKCILPIKVALLLKKEPQLISSAVTSFYYRDPVSMRKANRFSSFASPLVPVMVRFTRCLYAQILHQDYAPPLAYQKLPSTHINERLAYELGAKIALGFELEYNKKDSHNFLGDTFKEIVDRIFSTSGEPVPEDFPESDLFPSSSTEWMTIDESDLNDILHDRQKEIDSFYSNMTSNESQSKDESNELPMMDIVDKMKTFLSQTSDIDGIDSVSNKSKESKIEVIHDDGEIDINEVNDFQPKDMDEFMNFKSFIEKSIMNKNDDSDDEFYEGSFNSDDFEDDEDMKELMNSMDQELSNHNSNLWDSFERGPEEGVHEDLNLIKNMMESLNAQDGGPGPFGTMLHEMLQRMDPKKK